MTTSAPMSAGEPASPHGGHRVVITGMGAITPSGLSVADTWDAVVAGRSAISVLDDPTFADLPVRIGGRVRDFDAHRYLPPPLARRTSPVQQWAIAAADEAMRQAEILRGDGPVDQPPPLPWPADRFAIIAATGSGPVDAMQAATRALDARGPRAVPFTLSVYGAPDAAAALLAERYRAYGPSQGISATCASGAVGLGEGLRWIRHGYADAVLVVGMEDCLNPVNLASNAQLRALAAGFEERPWAASRPFDRGRSGFVMSAGAAAVLLESADAVDRRVAHRGREDYVTPLAELAGFGASSDAHHPTAPPEDGRGAAAAIRASLADAGIHPGDIDHINAHGTGTLLGDSAEIAAFAAVLGDRAHVLPISATKSSTGHLLGASGVLEAIVTVMSLRTGMLPPTINLDDPAFPDWDIVTGGPRRLDARAAISTSFGFGGHNGALVLRAWPDGGRPTAKETA